MRTQAIIHKCQYLSRIFPPCPHASLPSASSKGHAESHVGRAALEFIETLSTNNYVHLCLLMPYIQERETVWSEPGLNLPRYQSPGPVLQWKRAGRAAARISWAQFRLFGNRARELFYVSIFVCMNCHSLQREIPSAQSPL